jgi:NADH-quinone oxidoreductase subunit F
VRVLVGLGTCGIAAGAERTYQALAERHAANGASFTLAKTGCIGMCYREPIVEFRHPDGRRYQYGTVTPDKLDRLFSEHVEGGRPVTEWLLWSDDGSGSEQAYYTQQTRIVLRNCGIIDPESIEDYLAVGGYQALAQVLEQNKPEDLIAAIIQSGLRGRGGAGFSTGMKWRFARMAKGDHKYVICNADEGDPGAFMDRSVLESDPHSVLEGMAIAAFAIGADTGYIYCRAEYPKAIERLTRAIKQAEAAGWLGNDIGKRGFSFSVRLKEGAGAFVCGEETALIASIEGKRGQPKAKPPFPVQKGLWGYPTIINNVETLANVPYIIRKGAAWYASMGTEKSKGTKVFALTGKIQNSGLIEVPMGIPLKEVIYDIGGGIEGGKKLKAVQTGGPSGGCIPASIIETTLDYESLGKVGSIMGSGGMVVLDETDCMVNMAKYFLEFTKSESCGKCIPCRIGTKRLLEILTRITEGKGREGDIELLETLSSDVKTSSLCGLGQSAPNPVLSTIRYYRDEYEAHIYEKRCPAGVCKDLLSYSILEEFCKGCTACTRVCPAGAIIGEKKKPHKIIQDICIKCGACFETCKFKAIKKG